MGRGPLAPTSKHRLRAAVRKSDALVLRLQGKTYDQIADELDIAKAQAHRMVKAALEDVKQNQSEHADHLRLLELDRLDSALQRLHSMMDGLTKPAKEGDPPTTLAGDAVDQALRIEEAIRKNGESRRKLLGLDVTVPVAPGNPVHVTMVNRVIVEPSTRAPTVTMAPQPAGLLEKKL